MDDIFELLKSVGPNGAIIAAVVLYLVKYHVPRQEERFDKALDVFRADLVAARVAFTDALREERLAHAAATEKVANAVKQAIAEIGKNGGNRGADA